MTILQQPDILSLSSNIKEFRIATTETISFALKQGSEEIITQSYDPGKDGIVIINVRDIVHSRLSFNLQESALVYEQSSLAATFTAVISGAEVTFRVVRSGVDRLADTATNFLTQNFLTWQPSVKAVTYYSPEFLTYYAVVACAAKLRAYFTDDSGSTTTHQDITLANFDAGKAYTIPLQYASVAEKLGNKLPAYYDVWIESPTSARLTYIQRYYASDMLSEQEQWILFENSLGGIDTFRAYGSTDFTGDHTHNIAEIDEVSTEYRIDTTRKFQKNTGHLKAKERQWLLDFFPSQAKYIYAGTYLRSIVVIESNVTYTDRELPSNYTFTYKYADARPLLNLPRTDIPSEALNITVPSVGSFTVPPRLVEFPRLPLTEGALFPVQNPYSEKWGTATAGSISDFIAQRLSENYNGEGGVGHNHKNIDLLNLLSYIDEYLLVAGKKIKAIKADLADSAYELKTPNFTSGWLGSGSAITVDEKTGKTKLEVDEVLARDRIEAIEYRFNRVEVIEGEQWSTFAFGTIKSVDTKNQIAYLDLVEGELMSSHKNDLNRGIFHNISSVNATESKIDDCGFYTQAGFSTSYFIPTELLAKGNGFKYALRAGTTQHPCTGMKFAAYGNPTDPNRRMSRVTNLKHTIYLKDVSVWQIDPNVHYGAAYGDLTGITINGVEFNGYSSFQTNGYFKGYIEFLPEQKEELKGKDGYSVSLSSYDAVVAVNSDGEIDSSLYDIINIVSGNESAYTGDNQIVTTKYKIQTTIQATCGATKLEQSDVVGAGKYVVSVTATNCEYLLSNGVITITKITQDKATLDIEINCEGIAVVKKVFTLTRVYAERGFTGADGKDIEFIYLRSKVDNAPVPASENTDGFVPAGWTDNPTGTTSEFIYELISRRVKVGGTWGAFSQPAPWSRYAKDGKDGDSVTAKYSTDGKDWHDTFADGDLYMQLYANGVATGGVNRIVGETGKDGQYTDFQFSKSDSAIDAPADGWVDAPPAISDTEYLWMRSGTVIPPDAEPKTWTAVRIGGTKGDDGKDGPGFEIIFCRTKTNDAPAKPTGKNQDQYVPDGWTNDQTGTSALWPHEFASQRRKINGVWCSFSEPALWANYSFDGDDAYSVALSSYESILTLNSKGEIDSSLYDIINIVAGNELVYAGDSQVVTKRFKVQTKIYAWHGATSLSYADVAGQGTYSLDITASGCEYSIANGVITITKVTQDKASLDIVVNCEGKITFEKAFTITRVWNGQDANLLDWLKPWDDNKTMIDGEWVASPKMFSGTRNPDTGKLTGIAQGVDCITIDGKKRTGVFALVDDDVVFELDPMTKRYVFKGRVEADEGFFKGQVKIADGKILLNEDGSGQLANGSIKWDASGNPIILGKFTTAFDGKRIEINPETNLIEMYNENEHKIATIGVGIIGESADLYSSYIELYYKSSNGDIISRLSMSTGGIIFEDRRFGTDVYKSNFNAFGINFYKNGQKTQGLSNA